MSWEIETAISHALQILAIAVGLIQLKLLDKASKFFLLYLFITSTFEVAASITAIYYHNNLFILNLFSIVQFILSCIYFGLNIRSLNKTKLIILLITGIIIWTITSLIYIKQSSLNTPFLVFESLIIVILCLYYFYNLLNADDYKFYTPHYFITSLLLIFWSFTFMYWLFGLTIRTNMAENGLMLSNMIWVINILTYTGFGLVFLFYKKLQPR